jgi:hypothetical protein
VVDRKTVKMTLYDLAVGIWIWGITMGREWKTDMEISECPVYPGWMGYPK